MASTRFNHVYFERNNENRIESLKSDANRSLAVAMGFFALGHFAIYYIIVPLWALKLDASPILIGIAVGIRPLAPAILSIHAGALMDRLGVRRTLLVTAAAGVVVPLLMPVFPNIWALIILQLVGGLSEGLGWLGAQTRLAQVARGDTKTAGLFSLAGKFGTMTTPIIVGLIWDQLGPGAAFVFTSLWALAFLVAILLLPKRQKGRSATGPVRELLPRWSDYRRAFALLSIPVIAIIMLATFLRLGAFGIQGSFYPIWLEDSGYSASDIGFLIGAAALAGALSSVAANWLTSRLPAVLIMLVSVGFGIVGMAATPFATTFVALLALAVIFGVGVGVNLPVMLAVLSKVSTPETQGLSAGLRASVNRIGNIVIPIVMGLVVQFGSLFLSFTAVGIGLLIALGATGWFAFRRGFLNRDNMSGS